MKSRVEFRVRVYRDAQIAIGPGKVDLLEAIAETGSISAAARRFGMSYRRAWQLIDQMNRALVRPVVETATGGSHGGGTRLTKTGEELVRRYRTMEISARTAATEDIAALLRMIAP